MGAIRLFLALIVAADHFGLFFLNVQGHTAVAWPFKLGMNGGYAVMYFYIISGFLISLVLARKYPATPAGTAGFYNNRLIRIFSLYWPVAALSIILFGRRSAGFSINDISGIFPFGLDWTIAFAAYPNFHYESALPALAQAWTLGAELTFYLLAPWLLRRPGLTAAVFVLSALTRAWCVHAAGGYDQRWTYLFAPSTFLFFLLGYFAYTASRRWELLRTGRVGLSLLGASVLFLTVPHDTPWDSFRFWCSVLCFAAALPGVFEATKNNRLLNGLGDLSYPVYLMHVMVLLELEKTGLFPWLLANVRLEHHALLGRILPPVILAAVFLLFVIPAAWLAHWLLEKPVAWAMHQATEKLQFRLAYRRANTGLGPAP